MRIAIVNDQNISVELLRRIINGIPDCEVAWIAHDGVEAVEKCAGDTPDLIIMDIVMPKMDGVGATRMIMRKNPCPILIVTATVDGNSANVFNALGEGAIDAINIPTIEDIAANNGYFQKIVQKIKMLKRFPLANAPFVTPASMDSPVMPDTAPLLIAIGSSTGGPKALERLFSIIPADINAMFIVIQHIDKQFAHGMASWLKSNCTLMVKTAEPGDKPQKGMILLAGTNDHMIMQADSSVNYAKEPENNPFRPSVDVFFQSLSTHYLSPGIAVLLTGIGSDGAEGLLTLRRAGWKTFAQNRESCAVYGMPRAAAKINAAQEILSPQEIAQKIIEITSNNR